MVELMTKKNDFDLTDIFPSCRNDFDNSWSKRSVGNLYNEYSKVCVDYKNNIAARHVGGQDFQTDCIALGLYLNYINDKNNSGKEFYLETSCKYFFYKLKHLVNKHNGNCNNTVECYKKFFKKNENEHVQRISVPQVCLKYANDYDIHGDTLKIMEYLDEIYKWINRFNNNKWERTTVNVQKFTPWIEKLENHLNKYKGQLNAELEKIIQICESYRKIWRNDKVLAVHALYYLSEKWINERRMKINGTDTESNGSNALYAPALIRPGTNGETKDTKESISQALISTAVNGETDTGISVGMIFISFSILIIMFILYKYTPYFSFLKPEVRNLRRKLNKNNKNNLDFVYSFDVEYKCLTDNRYKIAYC
ncbi:variable surface protein [Plasmodium gonderi]|uniref:Variable surface protein n=1 Tax=Plasmodium gonderi TaxID=77519 RepID=A0A1Y1JPM7_PLAGO|nr:variable surface protein [Plasmodium gonderi]GAW84399.1 variable surface protein [Plasmodium gonderi]